MRREQGPKQCLLWKMRRSQKRDDREFRATLEALEAAGWMRTPLPVWLWRQRWLGLLGRRCGVQSYSLYDPVLASREIGIRAALLVDREFPAP